MQAAGDPVSLDPLTANRTQSTQAVPNCWVFLYMHTPGVRVANIVSGPAPAASSSPDPCTADTESVNQKLPPLMQSAEGPDSLVPFTATRTQSTQAVPNWWVSLCMHNPGVCVGQT